MITITIQFNQAQERPFGIIHHAGLQVGAAQYGQQLDIAGIALEGIAEQVDGAVNLAVLGVDGGNGRERLHRIGLDRNGFEVGVERLFGVAFAQEFAARHDERLVRLFGEAFARINFAELHTHRGVRGIEVGDLLISFERLAGFAFARVSVGDLQILLAGFDEQSLLRIQVRQLHRRLDVGGVELGDFLEHGDGFQREAAFAIAVGDARKIADGVLYAACADVEIAERVDGREVGWVCVNDFAILINRRRDFAL